MVCILLLFPRYTLFIITYFQVLFCECPVDGLMSQLSVSFVGLHTCACWNIFLVTLSSKSGDDIWSICLYNVSF